MLTNKALKNNSAMSSNDCHCTRVDEGENCCWRGSLIRKSSSCLSCLPSWCCTGIGEPTKLCHSKWPRSPALRVENGNLLREMLMSTQTSLWTTRSATLRWSSASLSPWTGQRVRHIALLCDLCGRKHIIEPLEETSSEDRSCRYFAGLLTTSLLRFPRTTRPHNPRRRSLSSRRCTWIVSRCRLLFSRNSSRRNSGCNIAFTSQPHSRYRSLSCRLARNSSRARTWFSNAWSSRMSVRTGGGEAHSS